MPHPPAPEAAETSRWSLPVLLALVLVSMIGVGVVIPLLPFYGLLYDAEVWQVTLLFAAASAGQFLGEPFWGRLSDKIGRRPVILVTILGSAVGYLALAFAPTIWLAIAARTVGGLFSGNISTLQSYVVDVTPPERLASRLGLLSAAMGGGIMLGPAIGGLLARPDLGQVGFQAPMLVAAGLSLAAAAGAAAALRESQHAALRAAPSKGLWSGLRRASGDPVVRNLIGAIFLGYIGFSTVWALMGLWGEAMFAWGPDVVGLLMAGIGVAIAVSQGGLSGFLTHRFGPLRTAMAGIGLSALTLLALSFADRPGLGAALLIAVVVAHSVSQPPVQQLVSAATDAREQGSILGAAQGIGALARVSGPIAAGLVFSHLGPDAPMVFAALSMAGAFYLVWRGNRRRQSKVTQ